MNIENSVWIKGSIGAVNIFAFLYDVITFPVYLVLQQPWKRRQLSRRIKVSAILKQFSVKTFEYHHNNFSKQQ